MSTKTTFRQDMQSDFCKLSPVQPEVRTGVYLSMKSCGPNATGSSTVRCKCVPKGGILEKIGLPQQCVEEILEDDGEHLLHKSTNIIGTACSRACVSRTSKEGARARRISRPLPFAPLFLFFRFPPQEASSEGERVERALPLGAGRCVGQKQRRTPTCLARVSTACRVSMESACIDHLASRTRDGMASVGRSIQRVRVQQDSWPRPAWRLLVRGT